MQEKLGLVLGGLGRYDEAIDLYEGAFAIYAERTMYEEVGRLAARIGYAYGSKGRASEGIARLEAVLDALAPVASLPHVAAVLYAMLAHLSFLSGQYTAQLRAATRAAEYARLCNDIQTLTMAENRRGTALYNLSRLDEALVALQEADRLAESVGDLEIVWRVHTNIGLVYFARGAFARVQVYAERAVQTALRLGDPLSIVRTLSNRGEGAMYHGEWAQARADFTEALARVEHVGETEATAYPLLDLAHLSLLEGAWNDLERYATRGLQLGEQSGDLQIVRWAAGLLAERAIRGGDPAAAHARLAPLLDNGESEETDVTAILPVLAWSLVEMDDRAGAATVAAEARRRARAESQQIALVDALRVSALIALVEQQWSTARSYLEEALTLARAMPYPHAEARLWQLYAEVQLAEDEGDALDAARGTLQTALSIFSRLGAQADRAAVRHDLIALPYRRHMQRIGRWISEGQWARMEAALPPPSRYGRPRANDRRLVEAITYTLSTGSPWADLPAAFGDDATAHRRYQQWQVSGVWARLVTMLRLPT